MEKINNYTGQLIPDLKSFNQLLLKNETFIKYNGPTWISICDTYDLIDKINILPDVSWFNYRTIQITNKRTYYELVKAWIDHNHSNVLNMDYKPNKAFALWVMNGCRK